jgi:hypothetical protein
MRLRQYQGKKVCTTQFVFYFSQLTRILAWPWNVQGLFEFPNRHFVRKEQNDFGWDWGPAFAPAGPWQPAYVVQLGKEDAYVRNTLVDIYREGQLPLTPPDQTKDWVLNASIDYIGALPRNASLNFRISDRGRTIVNGKLVNVTSTLGSITGSVVIPQKLVKLWWPVGMGPQTLYDLTIEAIGATSRPIVTVNKRIGFRTIVVNMWPIQEAERRQGIAPGNHWHFEVNGHEFFAKGSSKAAISEVFEMRLTRTQISFPLTPSGQQSPRLAFANYLRALSMEIKTCFAFGHLEHILQISCMTLRMRWGSCYGASLNLVILYILWMSTSSIM